MNELFEAVRAGDSARVQSLIDADPSLAIFAAAMLDQTDRVETQLAANRSLVSAVSTDGWTPLHLAAFFGAEATARLLLNKGADVNARSTNAMQNLALHAAAAGGHAAIVKLLLERGSPAGARQHAGWTALHAAAQIGNLEMADALLAAGAEVSARAENNQQPLDLALTKGHQKMVDLLEARGARL
jgi:ankyrin repeat protein